MASADVDVCNMALSLLGAKPIADLTEGTKAASVCATNFNDERDATLRAHPWNFALERAELGQLVGAPAFEWSFAYQLPTNPYCLRVLKMDDGSSGGFLSRQGGFGIPYVVEGRKLLTNAGTAKILYIARITSPTLWDHLFVSAFAARLAMTIAYALTEEPKLHQQMAALYTFKLNEARSIDGQEGSTVDAGNDILLDVRYGTVDRRAGWALGW